MIDEGTALLLIWSSYLVLKNPFYCLLICVFILTRTHWAPLKLCLLIHVILLECAREMVALSFSCRSPVFIYNDSSALLIYLHYHCSVEYAPVYLKMFLCVNKEMWFNRYFNFPCICCYPAVGFSIFLDWVRLCQFGTFSWFTWQLQLWLFWCTSSKNLC
jgi:hypothetical protein